ncbi:lipopolysaccharide transport periplasmic protein LptA [Pseudoxanthomonas kalamensis DSM 18571]|uniref:lipopolysaccharide transport periplasmic protein LptA n=1 Tax=Pseudoxanthomonas kalamensis TaxID=289483 RepID=UPI0013907153|nr:lipopolysaccharide transport periplasmic protein LptA [Pseudoxanthomonas kalamensis]KAF1711428.1 lipopolysaccharide transport periplasmic protein LptA [Pseudoxanthomonas kalamensis DSM 18571]
MSPTPRVSALLFLSLLAAGGAWAKSSDRNQPILLDSDTQEGTMDGNSTAVWQGNVTLKQGTLEISAARAELAQSNGDPSRAVFTGKQVQLKQQMDDGSWMNAAADRIDYDMNTEVIILTGNYSLKSPRGSQSGQRLVYDTRSGNMQAGGDGSRVKTVILPRGARGQTKVGEPSPVPANGDTP